MTRSDAVRLVAILGVLSSAACSVDVHSSEVSTREEKRFTVTAGSPVELNLRTFDGGITVRSWDRPEVLVEIERRGPDQSAIDALEVTTSQEGNRIMVEAPGPSESRRGITLGWVSPAVNLSVTAPRAVTLSARTGDGAIEASNLQGSVDLSSGDGRIVASRVDGRLKVHTGDGSIRIDEAAGQVDANSGDGSLEIAGRFDELVARTGDGAVRVDVSSGSTVKTDWRVTTGDGGISMRVPEGFNAAVDASTGDGSVRIEGLSATPNGDSNERRSVVGQLGTGGGTVRLRTGDGGITVTR